MKKPLSQLAELVEGNLIGDSGREISCAKTIACSLQDSITLAVTQLHFEEFLKSDACAAIVPSGIDHDELPNDKSVVIVSDVQASFAKIVADFCPPVVRSKVGISPEAIVSSSAKIADDVDIYPGAFIADDVEIGCGCKIFPGVTILERCVIGANVTIFPRATIYEDTKIGDRVIIHAGAVIGAYGFGYKTTGGQHILSAQLGNVVIENDVEVGANTTIDRGTYDSTTIGEGTKIDNLVIVAHNCQIGKHNLICSQVGIAGSCTTGDYVVMAGQVGVGDHLAVGDGAKLLGKAGIMQDVPAKVSMLGAPARPAREEMMIHAAVTRMPEIRKQLKSLISRMAQLESAIATTQEAKDAA